MLKCSFLQFMASGKVVGGKDPILFKGQATETLTMLQIELAFFFFYFVFGEP